ncbi:MAG: oxidoreductase [Candidatus Neomarinimicrobiota bacterium]|nr:MAG: oxidoreductase [Candidatus Neomarinimicrobiota bacterium]
MSFKDVLKPFTAWKNLAIEPVSIKKPLERQAAPRYRGFHKNNLEKCIGCGTCEEICQNAAIDMVPLDGIETKEGDSGLRPMIDYGRCCWCALCVDVCTTNSLTMSNHFTWVDTNADNFRFIPGAENKPWDNEELGYKKPENYELNNPYRVEMVEIEPEQRDKSFLEIVKGFSKEQAIKEADRCIECGLCIATCPAHMGIPAYIAAVRNDDMEEGLRVLYETNPLPEICGRVCTHKCESVCAMQHKGDALSIRWLKRYIADQVPAEKYKEILETENIKKNDKKIAIIGAGPAGLSAAYYLALLGYNVKIFEALSGPGGMTRYGIPEYRLPYDQIDKDVDYIKSLGVEFQFNTRIGKDITLDKLHEDFDAVFAGTGLHLGRSTRIDGSNHEKCYQAVDLLRDVADGKSINVEKKIVVIGGGNVAMDIARTLARLQNQKYGKVQLIITSLESEDIMPADLEEIVESREEKIIIEPAWGPKKIKIEDGKIKGLHVIKCLSVFDEEGRFNPKFDENKKEFFEADMVVEAIGQGMDLSYFSEEMQSRLEMTDRHKVKVDNNCQSSIPWLFVGGDIVAGPDVISAIADGHRAARGIDNFLSQK